MVMRAFQTALAPLRRRVLLMVRLGVLRLVRSSLATQELQVTAFDGEAFDRVKHLLPYGLNIHPHPGSEVLLVFAGGNTSTPVAIAVGGRDHRATDLAEGEVEIYDDQGQRIVLRRGGVTVETPFKVTVTAPEKVRFETSLLECTGDIRDRCDTAEGRSMSGMRETYDTHVHPENDSGGPTDRPTEGM